MPEMTARYDRTTALSEEEYFQILAAERRRVTLDVLRKMRNSIRLSDLASEVAKREDGIDSNDDSALERVKISLHHTHLPKMDDARLLDYDTETNRVTR